MNGQRSFTNFLFLLQVKLILNYTKHSLKKNKFFVAICGFISQMIKLFYLSLSQAFRIKNMNKTKFLLLDL